MGPNQITQKVEVVDKHTQDIYNMLASKGLIDNQLPIEEIILSLSNEKPMKLNITYSCSNKEYYNNTMNERQPQDKAHVTEKFKGL